MIAFAKPEPSRERYEPGELVEHRRYGYRGVVVEVDEFCQATDEWYFNNNTQPDRDQPWHHVLVHETATITYAAATSLKADEEVAPIQHPLISHFFEGFDDGKYIRNDTPWPTAT